MEWKHMLTKGKWGEIKDSGEEFLGQRKKEMSGDYGLLMRRWICWRR